MIISLIAAVDEQFGLGKNNALLCHLPADLQYFKSLTLGKPIIMGRNTFESIGRVLPGRMNIILSHRKINIDGATVVDSLEEAFMLANNAPEIMIIGGAQIYSQALVFAEKIYLTVIHHHFEADVFFPTLDKNVWECINETIKTKDAHNNYDMTCCVYKRKKK